MARWAGEHLEVGEYRGRDHERKVDAPCGRAIHTAELIAAAADRRLNQGRPDETESIAGARGGRAFASRR